MVTFFYIVSALLTDVQFAARIRMKICRLFFYPDNLSPGKKMFALEVKQA